MINILVPIKRVPDPYIKVKPLPDGSGLDVANVKHEINPFDEIALEAAIRLREQGVELAITVVSIGPDEAEEQLRKGLAMGADSAILVQKQGGMDSLGVAKEIAEIAKSTGAKLVIMGKQATDDDCNQASQMLAALLGWGYCSCASQISLSGSHIEVRRETDSGEQRVSLELPAIVTADLRLAEPRYIALPGIIKARSKPLEKRVPVHNDQVQYRVLSVESVPSRKAGKMVQSVPELVAELKSLGAVS